MGGSLGLFFVKSRDGYASSSVSQLKSRSLICGFDSNYGKLKLSEAQVGSAQDQQEGQLSPCVVGIWVNEEDYFQISTLQKKGWKML